ncbi:MAG: ATP-binding protein [Acidimicrobiaceae bacterium]|nr:ATP-binding protein [Acidimicrobiaceae bacterium]MCY4280405.1 ATP-binding protein [Acidimicrobiaceae bacterium]MCY4294347.1 ATP-binding protein [Acidimicrobiaceae bacterium]
MPVRRSSAYFPIEKAPPAPFVPSFGATPPSLVGRDSQITEICARLDGDPAGSGGVQAILAPRGIGKTVMLNVIEEAARSERGWTVVVTAGFGDPVAELHKAVCKALDQTGKQSASDSRRTVTGASAGAMGVHASLSVAPRASQRRTSWGDDLTEDLERLAEAAAEKRSRVLVSMDELHAVPLVKARQIGACLQHVVKRRRLPVVFVGAALPTMKDTLLADRRSTFVQRITTLEVGNLSRSDVRRGIEEPLADHGCSISAEALDFAASVIRGHPYMLQVMGERMWQTADHGRRGITISDARSAAAGAEAVLADHLFLPTWKELSDGDKRMLAAVALSDEDAPVAAAAGEAGGVRAGSVGTHRRRLILSGMIRPAGRGRVALTHPQSREWLRRSISSGEISV